MHLLLALLATASAADLGWDFDDGSLQGWEVVQEDTTAPMSLAVQSQPSWLHQLPGSTFHLIPTPIDDRNNDHDAILVRSPRFVLEPGSDVSLWAIGGQGLGTSQAPDLPGSVGDLASSTTAADGVHALGVAVRRVSDDVYVAVLQRPVEDETYAELRFPAASLVAAAGEVVTIDVFDTVGGRWAWGGFDAFAAQGTELPTLRSSGSCGGPETFDVYGLTPGHTAVFLVGTPSPGTPVPGALCAGATFDLAAADVRVVARPRADAAGEVHVTARIPATACGQALQVFDVASCTGSEVVGL